MRKKRSFNWYPLSLVCYGLLLTGVLLYLRYPEDLVQGYVAGKISHLMPGSRVEIGNCEYGFPIALQCKQVRVTRKQDGEVQALLERVTLIPLVKGFGMSYQVEGDVSDGRFSGVLELAPRQDTMTFDELEVNDLELDKMDWIAKSLRRDIHGKVNFAGKITISTAEEKINDVRGKLMVHSGKVALRQPIFFLRELRLNTFEVSVQYENGKLRVSDGTLGDPRLGGSFRGEIAVQDTLAAWVLAMTGTMTPTKEFLEASPQATRFMRRLERQYGGKVIPFQVSGRAMLPRFRFGNK